jgi:peptidoglycan/LPS O-acetylase OafA/YrhL
VPRPLEKGSAYIPGLDGIRALAVLAVLGFHLGVPHLGGGLLGVSMFFTLSGFLITGILLESWYETGGVRLASFYRHRARRLLPALGVLLLVVVLVTAMSHPAALAQRSREALSAAFYVSNWTTIAHGTSYFDYFAGPQPLEHLWSLAIEEQFYLVWPLLLLLLLRLGRGPRGLAVRVTLAVAAASFLWMAVLATPGLDHTRVYEGTDTRAGELLVGAVLALLYSSERRVRLRAWWQRLGLDLAGLVALVVVGFLVATTSAYRMSMYHGVLLVLALATAVLLGVVSTPGSGVGWVLGRQPLRWIGERSYGIYLWHMPVVALTPQHVVGPFSVRLAVFHVALTFLLAALSWSLIEDPIRRHGFRGAFTSAVPHRLLGGRLAPPVLVGLGVVCLLSVGALSVSSELTPQASLAASPLTSELPPPPPAPDRGADLSTGPQQAGTAGTATTGPTAPPATTPHDRAPAGAPRVSRHHTRHSTPQTSCRAVVHVGDSTSVGLASSAYLPQARYRIDAQYRDVGVRHVHLDISGARSIVETFHGEPNAYQATASRIAAGYDGCWVFAMGTNDTANQYVGGVVPLGDRIARIMDELHGQPALWLTVRTRLSSGPWAESEMQKWNAALTAAARTYPNLRIYDWASDARDPWYISDGIHFTSEGYRARASLIARALATEFPAGQEQTR